MREIPGQVAADDHVETAVRKVRRLRVHFQKPYPAGQRAGVLSGLLQHGRRQINCRDVITCFAEKNGEKARTGADIQDPELLRRDARKAARDLRTETAAPLLLLGGGQLSLVDFRIAGGASGPVGQVFGKDGGMRSVLHGSVPAGFRYGLPAGFLSV